MKEKTILGLDVPAGVYVVEHSDGTLHRVKVSSHPTPSQSKLGNSKIHPYFCVKDIVVDSVGEEKTILAVDIAAWTYASLLDGGLHMITDIDVFDSQHHLKNLHLMIYPSEQTGLDLVREISTCQHTWQNYTGLFESFTYCTKCDVKKTEGLK